MAIFAVLGAGSWGTALAMLLARNSHRVLLWSHDPEHAKEMRQSRSNQRYLPGLSFSENIEVQDNLSEVIKASRDILIVVPSHAFDSVIQQIRPFLLPNARVFWGTKGIDPESGKLFHEIVAYNLGANVPAAVLAGPSFAKEVAEGLPTAVTLATHNAQFADDLVQMLSNKTFRIYTSNDMTGVEICGLVKNVMAIATGIIDGLHFGANAVSALITRGLVEMTRLSLALGGKRQTALGLAGVGDLILTCSSNQSRNRRFGSAIASGKTMQQALTDIGQVVEGVNNLKNVIELADQHEVELPICEQVYHILYSGISAQEAVTALFSRDPKSEEDIF